MKKKREERGREERNKNKQDIRKIHLCIEQAACNWVKGFLGVDCLVLQLRCLND